MVTVCRRVQRPKKPKHAPDHHADYWLEKLAMTGYSAGADDYIPKDIFCRRTPADGYATRISVLE
jgi:hypothetical protein